MRVLDSDRPPYVSGAAGPDTILDMARAHVCKCDPVGPGDIAARLGIPDNTVHKWGQRNLLPPARWRTAGSSLWCWEQDIVPWLRLHPTRRKLLDGE